MVGVQGKAQDTKAGCLISQKLRKAMPKLQLLKRQSKESNFVEDRLC
jgi:hypothetical protein